MNQEFYSRSWSAGYDAADRLYEAAEDAYVATQLTMMVDRNAFMDGWIARKDAEAVYNDDPEFSDHCELEWRLSHRE